MAYELQHGSAVVPAPLPGSTHTDFPVALATTKYEVPEPDSGFCLRNLWRIAQLRRRTVAAALLLGLLAAAICNFVQRPVYRATAILQIGREQVDLERLDDPGASVTEAPDHIETQYRILRSRTLARRTIRKLGLAAQPEFAPADLPANIPRPQDGGESGIGAAIIDRFLDRLDIEPGKGTRLVQVSFESVEAKRAASIVNTLAEEYMDHHLEARWSATEKASEWLRRRLAGLKAELEASEARLHAYAAQHSILFVEERKDITTEKLAQLDEELTRAEAARIEMQSSALLAEDTLRRKGPLPGSLSSPAYDEFSVQLADLRRERAQLLVSYVNEHPKVLRLESRIGELEQSIEQESRRLLRAVQERHQVARDRERLLRQAVNTQRQRVNQLSNHFIQYGILRRDAQTNRQLYESLLERLKQAGVASGLRSSPIALLDPAEVPLEPYRPRRVVNVALGLFAGLMAGVALGFLQERFLTTVRRPEEVEELTGLKLLAVIPRANMKRNLLPLQSPLLGMAASNVAPARHAIPDAVLSEAYSTLRSSVLLGWGRAIRCLLVTSAQPEEGKTSVSIHLAASLARLNRKVLLIDADLRRSNCAQQLGLQAQLGLADYLEGRARPEQILQQCAVPGLWLIPGGESGRNANPADLLYSPRLALLLQHSSLAFDHIIIDSPPSLMLADARVIGRLAEAVVLVVSEVTDREALQRTKQSLDETGVPLLGFVMNRADLSHPGYGYYRHGYYGRKSVARDA